MTPQRRAMVGWTLAFAAFAAGVISGHPWALALGGLVLMSFGLALATNYRGLADDYPRRTGLGPFWHERSPALTRATFALAAVIGAVTCAAGVVRLLG